MFSFVQSVWNNMAVNNKRVTLLINIILIQPFYHEQTVHSEELLTKVKLLQNNQCKCID